MESPSLEKKNNQIYKKSFRIRETKKKKLNTTIKDIRNLLTLEIENKSIKDIILINIRNFFENERGEKFDKPRRIGSLLSNNYIEYKSNSDSKKNLSVEEYLNKIRPYL